MDYATYRDDKDPPKPPVRVKAYIAGIALLFASGLSFLGGHHVGRGVEPCTDSLKMMTGGNMNGAGASTANECSHPKHHGEIIKEQGYLYLSCVCKR